MGKVWVKSAGITGTRVLRVYRSLVGCEEENEVDSQKTITL